MRWLLLAGLGVGAALVMLVLVRRGRSAPRALPAAAPTAPTAKLPTADPGQTSLFPAFAPEQDAWGYIDAHGRFVIAPAYRDGAAPFSEGLAFVRTEGKTLCIDKTGRTQFILTGTPGTSWLSPALFKGGFALVDVGLPEGRRSGFITRTGAWLVPPRFSTARDFAEGHAAVALDGKWGFIDARGATVIPPRYRDVSDFADGHAEVEEQAGARWIGGDGHAIASGLAALIPRRYASIGAFRDDLALVRLAPESRGEATKMGFLDRAGRLAIPARYSLAHPFSEGRARALDRRVGFLDTRGAWIVPAEYDDAFDFQGGFAAVRVGRLWGFVGHDGKLAIPPSFDRVNSFLDGLARVEVTLPGENVRSGRLRVGYVDGRGVWIYSWEVDPPRLVNPAPER